MRRPAVRFRTLVRAGLAALAGALLAAQAPAAETDGPAATVDRLHAALIEVMKNADALGFEGRHERLAPVIRQSFDFPFISEVVLGRAWDGLSAADRERMVDTFTRLSIATYASRFDGYSGESFEHVGQKPMNRGRVLVRTRLVRPEKDAVPLDYALQQANGEWRIVNVVADGVSDLSLKRADYGSVMKQDGFEVLISRLEAQIASLEN